MGTVKGTVYGTLALMLVLLIKVNCTDLPIVTTETDATTETDEPNVCQVKKNIDQCQEENKECHRDNDATKGFVCKCKKGDEEDGTGSCTDPCSINPCLNDGICFVHEEALKCHCKSSFSGERCEKDPCTPKPCQNGGTCFLEGDTFRCSCISPFSGDTCETNPCTKRPCKNGGTCFMEGNTFKCSCVSPFSGYTCETNPCTKRPCQNGGTCYVEGDVFKCSCANPFSGDTCENNTGNMKIAVWILCTIVAVLVFTNGIIICSRYQQRKEEKPRNNC